MKLCELFDILLEYKVIFNDNDYGCWLNSHTKEMLSVHNREAHEFVMDDYLKEHFPELFQGPLHVIGNILNYTASKNVDKIYSHNAYGWAFDHGWIRFIHTSGKISIEGREEDIKKIWVYILPTLADSTAVVIEDCNLQKNMCLYNTDPLFKQKLMRFKQTGIINENRRKKVLK